MNLDLFYKYVIGLTLPFLEEMSEVKIEDTKEARVMLMAIAGQESNWDARRQYGGPARSYWQFEKGGGVWGVLNHVSTKDKIKAVCDALDIPCDDSTVYEAMAWNSGLSCSMARLLLFTDAAPLPPVGAVQAGWDYYYRNWRPGAPHPEVWPDKYEIARKYVDADPLFRPQV